MRVADTFIAASLAVAMSITAFGKGDNELAGSMAYFDRQAQVDGENVRSSNFEITATYLRTFKSFWLGGELLYASSRSSLSDSGHLVFGVPVKYWLKGPESKGIGLYTMATPLFGRTDDGGGSSSVLGLRVAPGLVMFLSDLVGIDIKFYYDYRRSGADPATTTGMLAGLAIYF